jgi:hypothetical protein
VTWLNETTPVSFLLVKVEAIRIGSSPAAPLLTLIVGPTAEGRDVGAAKKEFAARYEERLAFWTKLLDYAKGRNRLHANIRPGRYGWIGKRIGPVIYVYVVREHHAAVELYIDSGNAAQNSAIFSALSVNRQGIESAFGGELDWQPMEGRRASRVRWSYPGVGYRDPDLWDKAFPEIVDAMARLEKATKPSILKLDRGLMGEPDIERVQP